MSARLARETRGCATRFHFGEIASRTHLSFERSDEVFHVLDPSISKVARAIVG